MDAKRTSPPTAPQSKNSQRYKQIWKNAAGHAAGVYQKVSGKLLPWCRDHLLSVAVLIVVPVALGAFYWNRSTPDAPSPAYLPADRNAKFDNHQDDLPKFEEAPLASVVPNDLSPIETPQLLSFAHATGEGEFDYPLPIAVHSPERATEESQRPALPLWQTQILPPNQSANGVTECVWFTGGIEPEYAGQEAFQNTTRIHELTTPARD